MSTHHDIPRPDVGTIRSPVRCVECGRIEVRPAIVSETIRKNHDGRVYELPIEDLPVTRCEACGETYFDRASDERIVAALREEIGLLSPDHIRANMHKLNLNQKDLAGRLGIAPETLSRWLCGSMIQSRAMDNLLRAFFGSPQVREWLCGDGQNRDFGATVQTSRTRMSDPSTVEQDELRSALDCLHQVSWTAADTARATPAWQQAVNAAAQLLLALQSIRDEEHRQNRDSARRGA